MASDADLFLSHLVGDIDSGQGLEAEGIETFSETINRAAPPWFSLRQCQLQVRDRAGKGVSHKWDCIDICKRKEEEFRSQEPCGGQHAQDPGGKGETLGEKQCLPQRQNYLSLLVNLGGHIFPAGNFTPDLQAIELSSLLMSHRERDSLPQRPFDSTLTVGILPGRRANGRLSKR